MVGGHTRVRFRGGRTGIGELKKMAEELGLNSAEQTCLMIRAAGLQGDLFLDWAIILGTRFVICERPKPCTPPARACERDDAS